MKHILDWVTSREAIASSSTTTSLGLLVLRAWLGLDMAFAHGLGKLTAYSSNAASFADPLGLGSALSMALAVFAEFFCSLALALGVFTRAAVIPLITTMLVAALIVHADDPFQRKELAFLFLGSYLTVLITGPGKYSLDRIFQRR